MIQTCQCACCKNRMKTAAILTLDALCELDTVKFNKKLLNYELKVRFEEAEALIEECEAACKNGVKWLRDYGERGDFEVALEKIKAFKENGRD